MSPWRSSALIGPFITLTWRARVSLFKWRRCSTFLQLTCALISIGCSNSSRCFSFFPFFLSFSCHPLTRTRTHITAPLPPAPPPSLLDSINSEHLLSASNKPNREETNQSSSIYPQRCAAERSKKRAQRVSYSSTNRRVTVVVYLFYCSVFKLFIFRMTLQNAQMLVYLF